MQSGGGSVVIGYSLSAPVALGVSARLPELVTGVIAIDPPLILRNSGFEVITYSDASSLSQPLGLALGTQAGPARIREVTATAGFTRFRQAAQTPFNMVLEVRR